MAEYLVQGESITAVADAIREKGGTTAPLSFPAGMAKAVRNIQSGTDLSLGLTAATVGQTIKVKAVDTDGKPTAWEAVDAASGAETWELIAEIDVDVDAANDVFVWEYKNLPNYKELAYKKVNLVGSTETPSGISISINGSVPQPSGLTYPQKDTQKATTEEFCSCHSVGFTLHLLIPIIQQTMLLEVFPACITQSRLTETVLQA